MSAVGPVFWRVVPSGPLPSPGIGRLRVDPAPGELGPVLLRNSALLELIDLPRLDLLQPRAGSAPLGTVRVRVRQLWG